jgi:hypothetical protein
MQVHDTPYGSFYPPLQTMSISVLGTCSNYESRGLTGKVSIQPINAPTTGLRGSEQFSNPRNVVASPVHSITSNSFTTIGGLCGSSADVDVGVSVADDKRESVVDVNIVWVEDGWDDASEDSSRRRRVCLLGSPASSVMDRLNGMSWRRR